MNYWFAKGQVNVNTTLGSKGGFLVIYDDWAEYSIYDSVGHDDLLSDIAARTHTERSEVLNNGIRLFFAYVEGGILMSGVREIDNEKIIENPAHFAKIIKKKLR